MIARKARKLSGKGGARPRRIHQVLWNGKASCGTESPYGWVECIGATVDCAVCLERIKHEVFGSKPVPVTCVLRAATSGATIGRIASRR